MKKVKLTIKKNGFNGDYYISNKNNIASIILILGNEDFFSLALAKYLKKLNINVLGIYPYEKDGKYFKFSSFDIGKIESAVEFLKNQGIKKIAISGGSTWSTLALVGASYIQDISLVLAFTPCDFILEGLYQGKKNKMLEWSSNESSISYKGTNLDYVPYNLSEEEYWKKVISLRKEYKELHMIEIFEQMEDNISTNEKVFINVESIKGKIVFVGCKDDSMWNTTKYINRMVDRLKSKDFNYEVETIIYEKGTHFIFPEGMIKKLSSIGGDNLPNVFISGKQNKKEIKNNRIDLDNKITSIISKWRDE